MKIAKPVFYILILGLISNSGLVYSQKSEAPIIENLNQEPVQYCTDPVAVASLISIQNLSADRDSRGIKISISNYIKGEDVLIYDAIDSFQYSWSPDNGNLEITGIGTDADYEEAVSKVYYQNLSPAKTTGVRSISISLRDADYLPSTGHFYRFVDARWLSWTAAKEQASKMKYYGLQGYLVTIRSKEEQDFIMTKTRGTGWIGASDNELQGASEGTWMWVQGPDSGVVFWSGNWRGNSVNNEYSNWRSNEPNNQYPDDYAHILYSVNKGYWNDLPNVGVNTSGYVTQGFLIEFGEMPDDPEVKLSAIANIVINEREHPKLDTKIVKTLFCGSDLTQKFNIAFTNGEPETTLIPLDSGIIVTDQTTYSPSITVPAHGVYRFQLIMIDKATCTYIDTISLKFHKKPEASFNLDENECYGYNLPLTYTGKAEEGAFFSWYYNENEYLSGVDLDSVNLQLEVSNMEHTVGLRVNEQGCVSYKSQSVNVKPDLDMTVQNSEGCSPLPVSFEPSANKPIQSYNWNFPDGFVSEDENPSRTFINQTDSVLHFDVQLTVYSDDGCENTTVFEDLVSVYPVPSARFSYDPQEVYITNPEVIFTNSSVAATAYQWDFGDSTMISEMENPVHLYNKMGVYTVFLKTYSDFGCKDSTKQELKVAFEKLFPPNAFSPNSPLEEDREFRLYGEGVADENYQLMIFNRWGEVIFESSSQSQGWDGKLKNAEFAPAGVYTWVLKYSDFSGESRTQKGNVNLIF